MEKYNKKAIKFKGRLFVPRSVAIEFGNTRMSNPYGKLVQDNKSDVFEYRTTERTTDSMCENSIDNETVKEFNKTGLILKGPFYMQKSIAERYRFGKKFMNKVPESFEDRGEDNKRIKEYNKEGVILKGPFYMQKTIAERYGFGKTFISKSKEPDPNLDKTIAENFRQQFFEEEPPARRRSIRIAETESMYDEDAEPRDRISRLIGRETRESIRNTIMSRSIKNISRVSRLKSGILSIKTHERYGSDFQTETINDQDESIQSDDITLKDDLEQYYHLFPELDVTTHVEMTASQELIVKDNLQQLEEFRNYFTSNLQKRVLTRNIQFKDPVSSSDSSEESIKSEKISEKKSVRCCNCLGYIKRAFKR